MFFSDTLNQISSDGRRVWTDIYFSLLFSFHQKKDLKEKGKLDTKKFPKKTIQFLVSHQYERCHSGTISISSTFRKQFLIFTSTPRQFVTSLKNEVTKYPATTTTSTAVIREYSNPALAFPDYTSSSKQRWIPTSTSTHGSL